MNLRSIILPAIALTCGAAIALSASAPAEAGKSRASKIPEAKLAGEPVDCVTTHQIRNTIVRDNRTIDFEMRGGQVYRNTLPYSCSRLGVERAFSYRPTGSRLCSVDTIRVLDTTGFGVREGVGCGLGEFQPVELVKPAKG